jgi:hypothetical protein
LAAFGLRFTAAAFALDHLAFDPRGSRTVLAPFLLPRLAIGERLRRGTGLDEVAEAFESATAILGLGAFLLTTDFGSSGTMDESDSRGCLVDLLATGSRPSHERLDDLVR